jgi:hypothetical protein
VGLPDGLGERELRAYFAAVIGTFRAAFGTRRNQKFAQAGESFQLIQNGSRNKVLSVFVSRNDTAGVVSATFSQQAIAGTSDFSVSFAQTSVFRFLLYPDDALAMTLDSAPAGTLNIVIASEPY